MAKRKISYKLHGSFASKREAEATRKRVGGTIRQYKLRGQTRYAVISKK